MGFGRAGLNFGMSCRVGYGYWAGGSGRGRFGPQKSQPEPSLVGKLGCQIGLF